MKTLLRWGRFAARGVAAVEFAITLPILLLFMGGVTDFGIIYYRQAGLSAAVAAGAQYANLTDQLSPPVTAANIQTVLTAAAAQSLGSNITVIATASNPATCYCITGSSPSSTVTSTACGSTCTSGGTAGKYVQLTLSTNYAPMFPLLSQITGTQTLSKTAWVPLQ
jgi:Flp pilus assembly protein TadG